MKKEKKVQKFEIITRANRKIKSRQWWNKNLLKLRKLFLKALPKNKQTLFKNSSLTVLITNNKEITELNKKFKKTNKPTDVLSFHLRKEEQIKKKYLGDIVISIEQAKKQALKKHASIENELIMLLIHGYLHLLGYDHKHRKEANIMFSLQNKLLLEMMFY